MSASFAAASTGGAATLTRNSFPNAWPISLVEARGCNLIKSITPPGCSLMNGGRFTFGLTNIPKKTPVSRKSTGESLARKLEEVMMDQMMKSGSILAGHLAVALVFAGCSSTSTPPLSSAKSHSVTGSGNSQPQPTAAAAASAQTTEKSGYKDILQAAAAKPAPPMEGEGWISLFDGKTLKGWKATEFIGRGKILCDLGLIVFEAGDPFTGLNWTDSVPRINYEISLDAMRVGGSDFFCGLTIPVKDSCCSLIAGGWGGSLIGISSFDGADASENESTKFINFENGRWY